MKVFRLSVTILAWIATTAAWGQGRPKANQGIGQQYGCTAIQELPPVTAFDTAKGSRGLADNYYLWDDGATITVKFMTGSDALRQTIEKVAHEWEQFANIHFQFILSGNADVRVNLDDKGGHNSLIGIMSQGVPQDQKTMNLDTTDFATYVALHRTVLHEFGHAIGLLHEHYSPLAGIPWNKEAVYKELGQSQGWDKMTVDVNLFQQYNLSYTNGTTYDKSSIMHYPVLARWTTNGYAVPWNNELSAGDKALIAALYPKSGIRSREVPRFSVTDFTKMPIINSAEKQGLLIYPSFNVKTAGREGTVYFTVFFFDKDGQPIMDNNDKYNISNVVATYRSFKILPNKKLSANKQSANDFELYIPYSEIPVPAGTADVQAVFRAFLIDGEELKILYSSTPVNFNLIKP